MRFLMLPFLVLGGLLLLAMLMIPIWIALVVVIWNVLMPLLVVGFVVWLVLAIIGQPRRTRWERWSRRCPAGPPARRWPEDVPARRPRPVPPQRESGSELPIDVQVKVEQIRRKAEVLLGYAARFPPLSQDLYVVRQTATDYLPRTIEAYRALPPGSGERVTVAGGRTALQELKEQLDLLDSKLDEIAEDLQRQNVDRLLANRRFLEDRFGRAGN